MASTDHDSNSYNSDIEPEHNGLDQSFYEYRTMSLKELNLQIDTELLQTTLEEILDLPEAYRSAAIEQFSEADPSLGAKLRLETCFALVDND